MNDNVVTMLATAHECTIERLNNSFALFCMIEMIKNGEKFNYERRETEFEQLLEDVSVVFMFAANDVLHSTNKVTTDDILMLIAKFGVFAGIDKVDLSNEQEKKIADMIAEDLSMSMSLLLAIVQGNQTSEVN